MNEDHDQRLIAETLKFYRETVGWLEQHHAEYARKAELDLVGNDRPSAIWKLAGESIGAARALVDLLDAGYTTQTFPMMRSIHESNRLLSAVADLDRSTRFFWAASLAQVYPELAALADDGYIISSDEPHGARPRKTYRLTDKGRGALHEWLQSDRMPDFEFRDEGLLRLFFADALAPEEALELVKRLRARAEEVERDFRAEILPVAEAAPGRFGLIAAREGADYFAWRAAWFRAMETELADDLAGGPQ
jgi:DNA-binding PadR family transcriptional regulator